MAEGGPCRAVVDVALAARAARVHRPGRDARLDPHPRKLSERRQQRAAPERTAAAAADRPAAGHDHAAVSAGDAGPAAGPRLWILVGHGRAQSRGRDGQGRRVPRHDAVRRRHPPHPAVRADVDALHHRVRAARRQGGARADGSRRRRHADAGHGRGRPGAFPGSHVPGHLDGAAAAHAGDLLRPRHLRPARRGRLRRHHLQVPRQLQSRRRVREPRGRLRRLPLHGRPRRGRVGAGTPGRHPGRRRPLRRPGQFHLPAGAARRARPAGRRGLGRLLRATSI